MVVYTIHSQAICQRRDLSNLDHFNLKDGFPDNFMFMFEWQECGGHVRPCDTAMLQCA